MNEKTKKGLTVGGIIMFIALMTLITYFAGRPLIRYASSPEKFREWIDSYGAWGKSLFVGMMFLQTVVAFIPGEPFEIAAGYAFGAVPGMLLCLLGEVLGSITVFLFVKKFGVKAVEVFFSREKINSLKFLKNEKKLETIIFFVFLIPGTPKDLLCYAAGLTPMKLPVWLLISSVARFPSVISSTVGGNALGMGKRWFAVVIFAATLTVSIIGLFIYNRFTAESQRRYREEKRLAKREQKKQKRLRKRNTKNMHTPKRLLHRRKKDGT